MKKTYQKMLDEEVAILSEQLDPKEIFLAGYLKGFNRSNMKAWQEQNLWEIYQED